ncbi:hypothetical protein Bbelb_115570 [Branchiostoma belcheri]|nr:hypothetical protein Bbelb_115570 [Branchiostoma belcheri]
MSRLSDTSTVVALKRGMDKEHDRTAAMEQGLHKIAAIPYAPLGPSPTPMPRSASLSTAASCSKDYTEFCEICYKKSKTHKDFSEAEATCREDGGTLAMAKDAATNAFLVSTLDKPGDKGQDCVLSTDWVGQPTWADFDCRYSFFFICQVIP